MSFTEDVQKFRQRYPVYVRAVEDLLRHHHVSDVPTGWTAIKDADFRSGIAEVFDKFSQQEGAKVTFAIAFGIIGAALGGVGIAMLGTAFGAPLALVGAIAGLVIGNEADDSGFTSTLIRKLKAFKNG